MTIEQLCSAENLRVTADSSKFFGEIPAIASKSAAHRLLICAALGSRTVTVLCKETNNDIDATAACLSALGAEIRRTADGFTVRPIDRGAIPKGAVLPCGESGSTLRFLLPVAAALQADCVFEGEGRLPYRPMTPLLECLRSGGASLTLPPEEGRTLPLRCAPGLCPGQFSLRADVSSQFISGLLFALPLLGGESSLTLEGKVESLPYISMTLTALRHAGILPQITGNFRKFVLSPASYALPETVFTEGDWSNAAFFLVAGALSEKGITVNGIRADSDQGDKAICSLLREFGAEVAQTATSVTVRPSALRGIQVNVSQIPDLVPILSVLAAAADGETHIFGGARLRLKESDRLKTTAALLRNLGGEVIEDPDGLRIFGGKPLRGGIVSAFGDHRIAMSAAIASLLCQDGVSITGSASSRKSYPRFFADFCQLGGEAAEIKSPIDTKKEEVNQ